MKQLTFIIVSSGFLMIQACPASMAELKFSAKILREHIRSDGNIFILGANHRSNRQIQVFVQDEYKVSFEAHVGYQVSPLRKPLFMLINLIPFFSFDCSMGHSQELENPIQTVGSEIFLA